MPTDLSPTLPQLISWYVLIPTAFFFCIVVIVSKTISDKHKEKAWIMLHLLIVLVMHELYMK